MAKGDVVLKFDANTAVFVQEMLRVRQSVEETANKTRELGEKSSSMGDKVVGSASAIAMSFIKVGGAASMFNDMWSTAMDKMKAKAEALRTSVQTLEDTLFKRGSVETLPAVRAQLEHLAAGKISREGIEGIYASVSQSLGSRATDQQVMQSVEAAMGVITAGGSAESASAFGKTFGEVLVRAGKGGLDGMGQDDLKEVAFALQRVIPEGLSDRQWKAISRSKNPVATLDMIIGAARAHENARGIETVLDQADDPIDPKAAHAGTLEGKRLRALSKIPPDHRFQAMLDNPDLAPPASRSMLANLKKNQGTDVEDALANRPFAGQTRAFNRLVTGDPAAGAAFLKDVAGVNSAKMKQNGEVPALTEDAVWEQVQANLKKDSFLSRSSSSWNEMRMFFNKVGYYWDLKVGADEEDSMSITEYNKAKSQLEELRRKRLQAESSAPEADYGAVQTDVLRNIHRTLQASNANTGLKNNSEGQK